MPQCEAKLPLARRRCLNSAFFSITTRYLGDDGNVCKVETTNSCWEHIQPVITLALTAYAAYSAEVQLCQTQ